MKNIYIFSVALMVLLMSGCAYTIPMGVARQAENEVSNKSEIDKIIDNHFDDSRRFKENHVKSKGFHSLEQPDMDLCTSDTTPYSSANIVNCRKSTEVK